MSLLDVFRGTNGEKYASLDEFDEFGEINSYEELLDNFDVVDTDSNAIYATARAEKRAGIRKLAEGSTDEENYEVSGDPTKEIGGSGETLYRRSTHTDYNPELTGRRGIERYREMRNDATIRSTLKLHKTPVLAARWFVQPASQSPEDQAKASFVWDNLTKWMSMSFPQFVVESLLMCDYGVYAFEKVFTYHDWYNPITGTTEEKLIWRKFAPRPPYEIEEFLYDDNGGPEAVVVETETEPAEIEINKMLVFTYEKEGGDLWGNALDLDTPVPTPNGWATMRDLQVGEQVFDEQGRACNVVAIHEWLDRPTYKVTFSDGETIVADENHQWLSYTAKRRMHNGDPELVTTKEMAQTLRYNKGRVANHAIKLIEPVQYEKKDLFVDPYVLGYWLGDGVSATGQIVTEDSEVVDEFERRGYLCTHMKPYKLLCWSVDGPENVPYRLGGMLKEIGVLGNKHIPRHYLEGSVEQRIDLLRGLMDSDGYPNEFGLGEFCNTDKRLIDSVYELLISLGCTARIQKIKQAGNKATMKDGNKISSRKDLYRIRFPATFYVFNLERKRGNQRLTGVREYRYVKSIEQVEDRPTKCIEVDSPSHLFASGVGMVVSHNSLLRSAYKHWFYKEQLYKIDAIQKERHGIGIPIIVLPPNFSPGDKRVAETIGQNLRTNERAHVVLPPGWEVMFLKLEGQRVDALESAQHHSDKMYENVLANFMILRGESGAIETMESVHTKTARFTAEIVRDVINHYAIPQLMKYNWGEEEMPEGYPQLSVRRLGDERDWRTISFALRNFIGAQAMMVDDPLRHWIREEMDLPIEDPETAFYVGQGEYNEDDDEGRGERPDSSETPKPGEEGTPDVGTPRQRSTPPSGTPNSNAGTDRSGG